MNYFILIGIIILFSAIVLSVIMFLQDKDENIVVIWSVALILIMTLLIAISLSAQMCGDMYHDVSDSYYHQGLQAAVNKTTEQPIVDMVESINSASDYNKKLSFLKKHAKGHWIGLFIPNDVLNIEYINIPE